MSKTKKRRWRDAPSPCIGVCTYPGGVCKGCGMKKAEKKAFKRLSGKAERKPFLLALVRRLAMRDARTLRRWALVYRRKCDKRGVPCPLDKVTV